MSRSALLGCLLVGLVGPGGFAMAQGMQYTVTPENQPKDTAPAARMKAYSDLNQRLADTMSDPESSCLKSYAVYQACKSVGAQTCGASPFCTVLATLPPIELIGISFYFAQDTGVATLTPAMSGVTSVVVQNGAPAPIKMLKLDHAPNPAPATTTAGTGGMAGETGTAAPLSPPLVVSRPIGPVRIAGGVIAGNRISFVAPTYPLVAKMAHLGGTVVLHAIISKTGTIQDLQVASASNEIFEIAAIDAVRRWIYRPYLLNGQPTEVDTTITINFALRSPTPEGSSPPG